MHHVIERLALPETDCRADHGLDKSCFNCKDTPIRIDEVSVDLAYSVSGPLGSSQ